MISRFYMATKWGGKTALWLTTVTVSTRCDWK